MGYGGVKAAGVLPQVTQTPVGLAELLRLECPVLISSRNSVSHQVPSGIMVPNKSSGPAEEGGVT